MSGVVGERVSLQTLDALTPSGEMPTRSRASVTDVRGEPIADLAQVPPVGVARAIGGLRKASPLRASETVAALAEAAERFIDDEIAGLALSDYETLVADVSGLGISVVRHAARRVAEAARDAYTRAQYGRPAGAVATTADPAVAGGAALWSRRGQVFGVLAAGNHPAVHAHWLEALALGYRVALRPSSKEPLTAYRLVQALRDAGFREHVAFLPTNHETADEIVRLSDLSMVYGGDNVIEKYRHNSTVLPQGPGRSKIVITRDTDWRKVLELIVRSVSNGGGTGCTNTTAVFVEDDPVGFATELAALLGGIPSREPRDPDAILPVRPLDEAEKTVAYLRRAAEGTIAHLGADTVIDDLGDGSAVLRPAVHRATSSTARQAGVELGFPCVWVLPWNPADGVSTLRDSLGLTLLTHDAALVARVLEEPTISNVYVGEYPTYWSSPSTPHDSYLGDFLMTSKSVVWNRD